MSTVLAHSQNSALDNDLEVDSADAIINRRRSRSGSVPSLDNGIAEAEEVGIASQNSGMVASSTTATTRGGSRRRGRGSHITPLPVLTF